MASFGCNTTDEPVDSGLTKRPVWAWLAVAAASGVWLARRHPKASVAIGLGFALWRCCGKKEVCDAGLTDGAEVVTVEKSACQGDVTGRVGAEVGIVDVDANAHGVGFEDEEEDADEQEGRGGWLLNLEPMPLVVHEEYLPAKGQMPGLDQGQSHGHGDVQDHGHGHGHGQGDGLLDQGPGQAIEEMDWPPPAIVEETWLNEGVEIPDSVELPELEEPSPNTRKPW